jgi:hypothetical protein
MKLYVAGILCVSVTACTPVIPIPMPIPGASPKVKPASEVMNAAAVTTRDGAGVIVVTRDKQLRDMGCTYDISLDGQLVAGLRNGEQVTLYADPGEQIVGVSIRRHGTCNPAIAQVPVQVVASATTKIRVRADAYYDLRIEATTY